MFADFKDEYFLLNVNIINNDKTQIPQIATNGCWQIAVLFINKLKIIRNVKIKNSEKQRENCKTSK